MQKPIVLLLAPLTCGPALADTHISYTDDSGQPGTQIYVHDGKVRVEVPADQRIALYDITSQKLTLLLPIEGKYLSFETPGPQVLGSTSTGQDQAKTASDQATLGVDQTRLQQQQFQGQAQQSMSSDPFAASGMAAAADADLQMQIGMDQNTVTQDQFQDMGDDSPTVIYPRGPEVDARDLGRVETLAGRPCRDMVVTVDAKAGLPLCIAADPTTLGIPAPDLAALQDLRNSMWLLDATVGPLARRMHDWMADGFVLKISHLTRQDGKQLQVAETLHSIDTATLSPTLFQMPAGYAQTTVKDMLKRKQQ